MITCGARLGVSGCFFSADQLITDPRLSAVIRRFVSPCDLPKVVSALSTLGLNTFALMAKVPDSEEPVSLELVSEFIDPVVAKRIWSFCRENARFMATRAHLYHSPAVPNKPTNRFSPFRMLPNAGIVPNHHRPCPPLAMTTGAGAVNRCTFNSRSLQKTSIANDTPRCDSPPAMKIALTWLGP